MFTLIAQGTQPIDIQSQSLDITPIADLPSLVQIAASALLTVGTLAALMYLLLGAFKWLSAGGEKGKIEEGKQMITQAIIGLVVLASVFVIFGLVLDFLGLRDRFGLAGVGGSGGAGGAGGGGGSTAQTCPGGTAIGATVSDGGSGGYCTGGGAANVKCYAAGGGVSGFNYPHFEPCSCISGSANPGYTFNCSL